MLSKLQDSPPGKPFATRSTAPPLPFLLSSLLQSRPQLKLHEEQFGEDDDGLIDDLEESSYSEDESEFEELPSFRSLTKAQVAKLCRAQSRACFDELEYREKLFMKKQLKEEKRRGRMTQKSTSFKKDMAYTLHSETRFCNCRKNKATAGLSVTLLGDALSAGLIVEDELIAARRFRLVVSGGAMTGRGYVAYGCSLEAQPRDEDYPLGHTLSALGLSVMDWLGNLALSCNIQSGIPTGNLNNRQISIRVKSSEQLQIALIGLLPLLKKLFSYPQYWQSSSMSEPDFHPQY